MDVVLERKFEFIFLFVFSRVTKYDIFSVCIVFKIFEFSCEKIYKIAFTDIDVDFGAKI